MRSPAAGIPALSRVNPGDMISAQSTLMTTLETPGDLRVVFTVADRLLKGAALGLENKVKLSTENNEPLQGHLDYLSPELGTDTAARTFRARLSEESLKKVLPGNFIRVRLETSRLDGVFRVPQKAVRQLDNGLYQVFVLRDGKALARSVTVGEWVDTDWIITGGLQAGDRVIVNQLLRLRDGMSVTENSTARP